jgi:hypothetical protein
MVKKLSMAGTLGLTDREVAMTESKLQEAALRQRVRELLATGQLPVMAPVQVAAGYGHGRLCVACDRPVTNNEVEYEFDESATDRRLCFHSSCYSVWQSECAQDSGT